MVSANAKTSKSTDKTSKLLGVSKARVRIFAKVAGATHVSSTTYPVFNDLLRKLIDDLTFVAVTSCEGHKRATITVYDVKKAIEIVHGVKMMNYQ